MFLFIDNKEIKVITAIQKKFLQNLPKMYLFGEFFLNMYDRKKNATKDELLIPIFMSYLLF